MSGADITRLNCERKVTIQIPVIENRILRNLLKTWGKQRILYFGFLDA